MGHYPQLSSHRAKDMVLTDADFGRAYLTEGWAQRFLVDVFREFTVLFIGYSLSLYNLVKFPATITQHCE